jgi:hypothetical protein
MRSLPDGVCIKLLTSPSAAFLVWQQPFSTFACECLKTPGPGSNFEQIVAPPFPPNGARLDDGSFAHALGNLFPASPVEADSQSTEPAAPEKTLVRRVLLDVGSFALFRGVGMMFMLYRFPFQHFGVTPSILLAAISWRDRRHAARHDEIQTLL